MRKNLFSKYNLNTSAYYLKVIYLSLIKKLSIRKIIIPMVINESATLKAGKYQLS